MTITVPLVMLLTACSSSDGDTGGASSVSHPTQAESSAPGQDDTPTGDTPGEQPDGGQDDTIVGMIPASEALQQETTLVVEKYLEANYAGVGAKKLFVLPAEDQAMIQEARSDLGRFNALTDAEKTKILDIAEDVYNLSDTYVGVSAVPY